jgi:hypothetical protein
VTQCYEQKRQDLCANITTNSAGIITGITLVPFNFASQTLRGVDIEASYRTEAGPGMLGLRGLFTHYISNKTDNGIDFPFEGAGVNAGGNATPSWNYRVTANYDIEKFGFNLTGRGFSSGVYDNSFIECQTTCPVSTVKNRTINDNHIAGAFYLDASLTYRFEVNKARMEAFVFVRNVLNTDPVLVGNGPTGNNTPAYPQTNRNLYDVLGRVFRMGIRMAI